MINNKQMKLYTEEALKDFLTNKQSFITLDDFHNLESIELPSDEEIGKASFTEKYQVAFNPFASGVKWLIDKIKGGNK